MIPKQSRKRIPCRVSIEEIDEKTPVLFQHFGELELQDGLHIQDSLLTLRKGNTSHIYVGVTNNTVTL